ncbi:FKBP-type peptidyl-prolyl cis-trans isomerase [Yeosuana sp. AK3]
MRIRKITLYFLCLILGFLSCKKDDNNNITIELRDRTEQQIVDNDSIVGYLETHYYNASAFGVSNLNPSIEDLIISKLPDDGVLPDPANNTLLIEAVETFSVVFADTDYDYYILRLNQGGGESPTFADKVRVNFEGFTLDDIVFDRSINASFDADLITEIALEGWRRALPLFSVSDGFNEMGDGTVSFVNSGVGVMFLPSGLAYFASPPFAIPQYSPLVFKFELLQMSQNDHDGDGVPSYMEDLNGDGNFSVNFNDLKDTTDDDSDGDGRANFDDIDDDADGILTQDEIVVTTYNEATKETLEALPLESNQVLIKIKQELNGTFTGTVVTFTDTDADGIPDYLDKD